MDVKSFVINDIEIERNNWVNNRIVDIYLSEIENKYKFVIVFKKDIKINKFFFVFYNYSDIFYLSKYPFDNKTLIFRDDDFEFCILKQSNWYKAYIFKYQPLINFRFCLKVNENTIHAGYFSSFIVKNGNVQLTRENRIASSYIKNSKIELEIDYSFNNNFYDCIKNIKEFDLSLFNKDHVEDLILGNTGNHINKDFGIFYIDKSYSNYIANAYNFSIHLPAKLFRIDKILLAIPQINNYGFYLGSYEKSALYYIKYLKNNKNTIDKSDLEYLVNQIVQNILPSSFWFKNHIGENNKYHYFYLLSILSFIDISIVSKYLNEIIKIAESLFEEVNYNKWLEDDIFKISLLKQNNLNFRYFFPQSFSTIYFAYRFYHFIFEVTEDICFEKISNNIRAYGILFYNKKKSIFMQNNYQIYFKKEGKI